MLGVCMMTLICLSPSRCNDGRRVGSLPKLMYRPNMSRGEVCCADLKDHNSSLVIRVAWGAGGVGVFHHTSFFSKIAAF